MAEGLASLHWQVNMHTAPCLQKANLKISPQKRFHKNLKNQDDYGNPLVQSVGTCFAQYFEGTQLLSIVSTKNMKKWTIYDDLKLTKILVWFCFLYNSCSWIQLDMKLSVIF